MAEQGSVGKHLGVVSALKDAVSKRKLLEVSVLEQEMVCDPAAPQGKHYARMEQVLRNPQVPDFDKLRVVLIYALRYEKKMRDTDVSKLRSLVREHCPSLGSGDAALIQAVLRHYGQKQRQSALFADEKGGLLGRMGSLVQSQLTDVECVYTQHSPLLDSILDRAVTGKLHITDYPSLSGRVNSEVYVRSMRARRT